MQAHPISLLFDNPTNYNALRMPGSQISVMCRYSALLMPSKRNGNNYGSLSTFISVLGINFILAYVYNV